MSTATFSKVVLYTAADGRARWRDEGIELKRELQSPSYARKLDIQRRAQ